MSNLNRKQFVTLSASALCTLGLAGCGGNKADDKKEGSGDGAKCSVYFLNFKPEADKEWQDLAKKYTEETKVPVKVVTAASDTYAQTFQSEINKEASAAPTLFQTNGPSGLIGVKDYCIDLKDAKILGELTNDALKLEQDGVVYGVDYVEEDFGIIYNKKLLEKAGYKGEDIKDFASLKKIVEDIQARKDEIGVKGAFTSAGLDSSSDWRFTTHLANLPLYYEFKDTGKPDAKEIKGTYLPNYKQIFDLYINNSTCDPTQLAGKTGDDSVAEFVNQEAVFYQNGTWAYNDIKKLGDDALGMIPIYIGVKGEEKQGMCSGGENYWCVSSKADEDSQQATLDFMYWCVTSDTATKAIAEEMGLTIPFKNAKPTSNALANIAADYAKKGNEPVAWDFIYIPSQEWKTNLSSALKGYAAGTEDWDAVKTAFVDGWKTEKEANAE